MATPPSSRPLNVNINTDNIKVSEIKLWETNNSAVIYTEN